MIVVPQQGDFADAWDAATAQAVDGDTLLVPPGAYTSSRPVTLGKRLLVFAWGAVVTFAQCAGLKLASGAARSIVVGLDVRSTSKADITEHGYGIECQARLVWCVARKFGGDGFHVSADINLGTNANTGTLFGCESTGHGGRGFSWIGGDSNAWTVLACTTSGCAGEYAERGPAPRVAGFHDRSFLGNRILGCHSGTHDQGALGYWLAGDSSRGVALGCYQESGHAIRVEGSNVAVGNLGALDATGTGFAMTGRTVLGRMTMGAAAAEATWNAAAGLLDLRSSLDAYGYALRRETTGPRAGWWVLRRANTAGQDVLALRADGKAQAPAEVWAPLGVRVGPTQRLVDAALLDSIEARLFALEAKP